MITLGLDIGSNSVGSAWVDNPGREITLGVGVFPAGVEQSDRKRGSPINQARRQKRSLRRTVARRARRKRRLRHTLIEAGLLPRDPSALNRVITENPWHLRRRGLKEALTPHEFGRVLLHINQRRGALGVEIDPEDTDEGKVKKAIDRLRRRMCDASAETFGQYMANLMDTRTRLAPGKSDVMVREPIRNRQGRLAPEDHVHADRDMIHHEFCELWRRQKAFGGPLADLLTDELKTRLDDPRSDATWRRRGIIFGQRRTYWATSSLGRCDLQPTDRCCPLADMHAQHYRVVEFVNNIRIEPQGHCPRHLTAEERDKVIAKLRSQKTASAETVRRALGLAGKDAKSLYGLNIERDESRRPNTDWFYREIIDGVFGRSAWDAMDAPAQESVNRAILKFDPEIPEHAHKLRAGAADWWGLDADRVEDLMAAWKRRPRLSNRLNLSRRAILNLLPYMERPFDGRWLTQNEARQAFARDADALDRRTGRPPSPTQRARYDLDVSPLTRRQRRWAEKHPDTLPPAPEMSNPVVRKAIHEVRRHVDAHLRRHGRKPDRIVIELAREAKLPAIVRNRHLARNRRRNDIRRAIDEQYGLERLRRNQQRQAEERVVLCRQQAGKCPYCEDPISESAAAGGENVETDHIVPYSRCGDNALSNRVVCHRQCNRGKGALTPREWLSDEQFARMEARLAHFENPKPDQTDYFTAGEYARKWENLHRTVPDEYEWTRSQLTDTAYAARELRAYLENALYADCDDGKQRIFFTKGAYTSILRRDWQLQDQRLGKVRDDHRHHAIDALVVALTDPPRLQQLARAARECEQARAAGGGSPERPPLPPPWGDVESFRAGVMERVGRLIVSHRPVRRRLVGRLHKDTAYGPVLAGKDGISDTLFTSRIPLAKLKSAHLRLPEGADEIEKKLLAPELSRAEWRGLWRRMTALPDCRPKKGGIVRDLSLRFRIRKALRNAGLDPDNFSEADLKRLLTNGPLAMPAGTPLKRIVLLRTIKEPVTIPGRESEPDGSAVRPSNDARRTRVYDSQSNHHIEIREDARHRWKGRVVTARDAALRVRRDKLPAVDRSDTNGGRFVMSLAEGEAVCMSHPKTGEAGCYVVFKLDRAQRRIHFIHHWDARPSQRSERQDPREGIPVTVAKLRDLGMDPDTRPFKVRVGPLGDIRRLDRD